MTPDPEFLYLSPSHKEALASVIYGVKQRKGFVAIVGEVGVGKTTILRSFLEIIYKEKIKVVYIFNVDVSFQSLLKRIYIGLGRSAGSDDVNEMLNHLYEILIEEYRNGYNVVIIIDEAQNMPLKTLERLRMLSNLETSTDKLIQTVFSGQPEFEKILDSYELRQLRQRIAVKSTIKPLTVDESIAYVKHRLDKASVKVGTVFPDKVLRQLVRQAKGIPRTINILCDNCLISSFGYKQKKVSMSVLKEISSDLGIVQPSRREAVYISLMLLIIGLICFMIYNHNQTPKLTGNGENRPAAKFEKNVASRLTTTASNFTTSVQKLQNNEVPQVVEAKIVSDGKENLHHKQVIRKGDTLANLVKAHYGSVDSQLIELVKQNNPWIKNVNRIVEGERIAFPPRD